MSLDPTHRPAGRRGRLEWPPAPQGQPPAPRQTARAERRAKRADEVGQRVARHRPAQDDHLAPGHRHPQQQRILGDQVGEYSGASLRGAGHEPTPISGLVPTRGRFVRRPPHQIEQRLGPAALGRRKSGPGGPLRTHLGRSREPRERPVLVELDVLLGERQAVGVAAGDPAHFSANSRGGIVVGGRDLEIPPLGAMVIGVGEVIQGVAFAGPVAHLAQQRQRLPQVHHGRVGLADRLVDAPDVIERPGLTRAVPDGALDRQPLIEVGECRVVPAQGEVDPAHVGQRDAGGGAPASLVQDW